jgi:hypothetical protein
MSQVSHSKGVASTKVKPDDHILVHFMAEKLQFMTDDALLQTHKGV